MVWGLGAGEEKAFRKKKFKEKVSILVFMSPNKLRLDVRRCGDGMVVRNRYRTEATQRVFDGVSSCLMDPGGRRGQDRAGDFSFTAGATAPPGAEQP